MDKLEFVDGIIPKYLNVRDFSEGLAPVKSSNGLWGFINKKGEEVIPCIYDSVDYFSEGLAKVSDSTHHYGFINKKGEVIVPCDYNWASPFREGMSRVCTNMREWGFIDKTGNEVIKCQYEDVHNFHCGLALIKKYNFDKYGFINKKGEEVIPSRFETAEDFKNGFTKVRYHINGDFHIINKRGKDIGHHRYVQSFNNGYATVSDNFKTYYNIDTKGKLHAVCPKELKVIGEEKFGLQVVINKKTDKYGFVDNNFNIIIPCEYDSVSYFCDGVSVIYDKSYPIALLKTDGTKINIGDYKVPKSFSEGLLLVRNRHGLWGYLDINGEEVIKCQFKEAYCFNNGRAVVRDEQNRWFTIDKHGKKSPRIKDTYISSIDTGYATINIKADTKKELSDKKLEVLKLIREDYSKMLNDLTEALIDENYQLSRKAH